MELVYQLFVELRNLKRHFLNTQVHYLNKLYMDNVKEINFVTIKKGKDWHEASYFEKHCLERMQQVVKPENA
jgi:hypothetical protein